MVSSAVLTPGVCSAALMEARAGFGFAFVQVWCTSALAE
jgi:hypothetical protein